MTEDDICHLGIAEARRAFADGTLAPEELVEATLARIARIDPLLDAYIAVDAPGARRAAREAAARVGETPLAGIPFAVKDNYATRDLPTTANARRLQGMIAGFDAAAVARLRAAGGVLTGKLATWEYGTGLGVQFHDAARPHARNPWAPDHFPGGSSTGSAAAVAAGLATYALGSDTGGSIRVPAAACGLHGLKPTYGLLSRYGVLPNSWSLDVIGPLARSARDCAIVLQALAGVDPRDPATVDVSVPDYEAALSEGVAGLRIGLVREIPGATLAPAVAAGLDALAASLAEEGATIVEAALPEPLARYRETTTLISGSERACAHEADFRADPAAIGREVREALTTGVTIRAVDYLAALRRRAELARGIDALFERCDALILPTTFATAPSYRDPDAVRAFMAGSTTAVFSLSGHPAHALPTGFDAAGLPTSAQVVGPYFGEAVVLRIAHAVDLALADARRRPRIDLGTDPRTYPPITLEPEPVAPGDEVAAEGFARLHGLPLDAIAAADYARGLTRSAAAGAAVPRPSSLFDGAIATFRVSPRGQ
ncbi:amidase [Salinarimonas ramus]|uniref:Glutamyl-tRNA(Gln) amidotransferase n=1 Tax=Salinarimonas ramus TaxID=690164 RepID=A0A917Q4A9_9HYPH|nr:amidase [Salinarimonas ramus]GGK20791.1 glutamyl-tRNA(Gln) amidotransferase [Salinarimonas ramus]